MKERNNLVRENEFIRDKYEDLIRLNNLQKKEFETETEKLKL
jgi:hypothetical protein